MHAAAIGLNSTNSTGNELQFVKMTLVAFNSGSKAKLISRDKEASINLAYFDALEPRWNFSLALEFLRTFHSLLFKSISIIDFI